MSTHYGRMVVARRPRDHVRQPRGRGRVHRLRPEGRSRGSHVREGRREVLRAGHPHPLLGREPRELGAGRRGVREGLDRVLPRLPGPRPAGDPLVDRGLPEVLPGALREGHVRGRPRRRGDLPADVPEGVVRERLQHLRAGRRDGGPPPGPADRQRALRPARRRPRAAPARGGPREVRLQGREALHGRVERRLARLQALRRRGRSRTSRSASSWASPTSTSTRARRSGRWTRTPSTSPTSTRSRPATRSSTSSSSTSACRGSRTSASWRRRSATSTPAWPS